MKDLKNLFIFFLLFGNCVNAMQESGKHALSEEIFNIVLSGCAPYSSFSSETRNHLEQIIEPYKKELIPTFVQEDNFLFECTDVQLLLLIAILISEKSNFKRYPEQRIYGIVNCFLHRFAPNGLWEGDLSSRKLSLLFFIKLLEKKFPIDLQVVEFFALSCIFTNDPESRKLVLCLFKELVKRKQLSHKILVVFTEYKKEQDEGVVLCLLSLLRSSLRTNKGAGFKIEQCVYQDIAQQFLKHNSEKVRCAAHGLLK